MHIIKLPPNFLGDMDIDDLIALDHWIDTVSGDCPVRSKDEHGRAIQIAVFNELRDAEFFMLRWL